jgi:hypothetical protein
MILGISIIFLVGLRESLAVSSEIIEILCFIFVPSLYVCFYLPFGCGKCLKI